MCGGNNCSLIYFAGKAVNKRIQISYVATISPNERLAKGKKTGYLYLQ
jgi:hypothetical protein